MDLRSTLNQGVWNIGQQSIKQFGRSSGPQLPAAADAGQVTLDILNVAVACSSVWGAVVEGAAAGSALLTATSSVVSTAKDVNTTVSVTGSSPKDVDTSMLGLLKQVANTYTAGVNRAVTTLTDLGKAITETPNGFEFDIPDKVRALKTEKTGDPNDPNNEFHLEVDGPT